MHGKIMTHAGAHLDYPAITTITNSDTFTSMMLDDVTLDEHGEIDSDIHQSSPS